MKLTMNLHNIVRARVETFHSQSHVWQELVLETSKTNNRSDPNPLTDKESITIFPHSRSFNPTLPNTKDVEEAVGYLRHYLQVLHEESENNPEAEETCDKVERLISRLGYPIVEPGDIEL